MKKSIALAWLALMPTVALGQDSGHRMEMNQGHVQAGNHGMNHGAMPASQASALPGRLQEGGQSAFAAIQEVVALLLADPQTDWTKANVEELRRHLVDMDNVTLRSDVETRVSEDAVRFEVTGATAPIAGSIRRMVLAHARTMDGVNGWTLKARDVADGAELTVTPSDRADLEMIGGLGFIGIMTVGMHHQDHHLAIALGRTPH